MIDPVRIYVGFEAIVGSNGENSIDDSLSANKRVSQTVEVIEDRARESRLRALLNQYHGKRNNRVLVFALYKKEAERLEHQLRKRQVVLLDSRQQEPRCSHSSIVTVQGRILSIIDCN